MTPPTGSNPPWPSQHWADWTSPELAALAQGPHGQAAVALLPVAAIEQHGPHLPMSVDADIVDGIVAAALPRVPAALPLLVLPTLSVGRSVEHEKFAGTLSLSAQTTLALWMDVGASVSRAGIKKLLIFNSHGGHAGVLDIATRDLRSQHGLAAFHSSWDKLPLGAAMQVFSAHEQRFGAHAGDIETSLMLALKPERVRMALAQDFKSSSEERAAKYAVLGDGKSAKFGWQMQDINPQGAAGNAAAATAEKGRALLDAAAGALAQLIGEISALPLSVVRD